MTVDMEKLFRNSVDAAKHLLGMELITITPQGVTAGIIVETEAYHQHDSASHSFRGKTKRSSAMFERPGTVYVYLSYGLHYCLNIVTGPKGQGEAVLIRALQPTQGVDLMKSRRNHLGLMHLCSGPAKLTQALGIDITDNNTQINNAKIHINSEKTFKPKIITSTRIGISNNKDAKLRFYIENSPFVSVKHKL